MTRLSEQQSALDLYGGAVYWERQARRSASRSHPAAQALETILRDRARAAGCSDEQIADADTYATQLALSPGRSPLRAEVSFDEFRRRNNL